jgi:hypothetical protein
MQGDKLTALQQQVVSLGVLATGIVALPLLGALTTIASMALLLYPAASVPERVEVRDRCCDRKKRYRGE